MISVHEDDLHDDLNERLDQLHSSQAPLLVKRRAGRSCVIVEKTEWDGLMTTIHLLNSPANAARLLRSIRSAEANEAAERCLDEL